MTIYIGIFVAGEVREAPVVKVPGIAVAMQHSLLKRISAFRTKEVRLY
jgi:hypothetical protein